MQETGSDGIPRVGTSPRWGSCAASSKCSCKQAFLLASDGMTEERGHAPTSPRWDSYAPIIMPQAKPHFCTKAMPSPSGEGGRRGTSLTDEGSRRETIPVLSPSSAPSAESSRRRKERRRQRSRFLPTMAKTSVRRARTPHRGDAHNARLTPKGKPFERSIMPQGKPCFCAAWSI